MEKYKHIMIVEVRKILREHLRKDVLVNSEYLGEIEK